MTTQEAFDWVITQLITQGGPSSTSDGRCYYRAGNLRCAVGCLIPDGFYNPDMEDRNVREVLWLFPSLKDLPQFDALIQPDGTGYELLEAMQLAHDSAADAYRHDLKAGPGWAYRLHNAMWDVASKFNLAWNFKDV